MKTETMKFPSEEKARKVAEKMMANFDKDDLTITEEPRALVVIRPDQWDGVITVRYEW